MTKNIVTTLSVVLLASQLNAIDFKNIGEKIGTATKTAYNKAQETTVKYYPKVKEAATTATQNGYNIVKENYPKVQQTVQSNYPKVEKTVSNAVQSGYNTAQDNYPKVKQTVQKNYPKVKETVTNSAAIGYKNTKDLINGILSGWNGNKK